MVEGTIELEIDGRVVRPAVGEEVLVSALGASLGPEHRHDDREVVVWLSLMTRRRPTMTRRQLLAVGAAAALVPRLAPGAPATVNPPASLPVPGPGASLALGGVPRGARRRTSRRPSGAPPSASTTSHGSSRGDTVLIKVASNSGNEYPATTDPVAIRAMVELLRERGARRVIVADMSGVQFVRFWKDGLRAAAACS